MRSYPLSLLCFFAILYLSFFTPPEIEPLEDVPNIDKLVHTLMYGAFCFLIWSEKLITWERSTPFRQRLADSRTRQIDWRKAFVQVGIFPWAMSGIIEILQEYCTDHRRSGSWWDFAANTLGVVMMWFVARWWCKRR